MGRNDPSLPIEADLVGDGVQTLLGFEAIFGVKVFLRLGRLASSECTLLLCTEEIAEMCTTSFGQERSQGSSPGCPPQES